MGELEKAVALKSASTERFWLLPDLSQAAYEAKDWDKARAYANELLTRACNQSNPFAHDGNAVHVGNLVLGRIALSTGNRDLAKKHLIESIKCAKTPNLISYGPSIDRK